MLVSVGLDQKTGSPRGAPALSADALEVALAGYAALDGVDEVAVFSAGSFVEVFAWTSCPAAATVALRHALGARVGPELALAERRGAEALRHLARIASGMEDAADREPQLARQVEGAFSRAIRSGAAGRELEAVLDRALHVASRVRSETAMGASQGHAAAELAEKVIGPLTGRRVAVIGAAEPALLAARHLRDRGAGSIVVVGGAPAERGSPAAELCAEWRPLDALGEELLRADVVVSAVSSAPALLGPEPMARSAAARRRPLVLVDLAAPRAIPAETGRLRDVYLCDAGDLDRVLRAALGDRVAAIAHAERVIDEEIARWVRAEAERRAAPLIAEIEARAAAIAREEVARTLRRVGVDPELALRLDAMACSIVSKLLHQPSVRLREAACAGGEGEAIVAAAHEIFAVGATRRSNVA